MPIWPGESVEKHYFVSALANLGPWLIRLLFYPNFKNRTAGLTEKIQNRKPCRSFKRTGPDAPASRNKPAKPWSE
jgi:hypothetical protein